MSDELARIRALEHASRRAFKTWSGALGGRSGAVAPFIPRRTRGRPQPTIIVTPPLGETITVEATSKNASDQLLWSKHPGPVQAGFDTFTDGSATIAVSEDAYYDLHIEALHLAADGGATVTAVAGGLSRTVATADPRASDELVPQTIPLGLLEAGTAVSLTVSAAVSSARATLQLVDTPRSAVADAPAAPVYNDLLGWWMADAIEGLADGAEVTSWVDLGPHGYHLNQLDNGSGDIVTGGAWPLYVANGQNGLPVVSVGPDTERRSIARAFGDGHAEPLTLYIAVRFDTLPARITSIVDRRRSGSSAESAMWVQTDGTTLQHNMQNDATFLSAAGAVSTGWHVVTVIRDGSSRAMYVDGASVAADTAAAVGETVDVLRLGDSTTTTSRAMGGAFAEVIAYDAAHNAAQRAEVWTYLTDKWGL